jgi:hypothetical protein
LIPGNLRNVIYIGDRRGRDRMVVGFTTTYALTTDVVSSNLDQGEVYKTVDIHTILINAIKLYVCL